MTRINLISPQSLYDQHLLAEIKEINQLAGSFRKSLQSANGIQSERISKQFTLNTGHVYFFYDKGLYLHKRFDQLKREAIARGFNVSAEFNNEWTKNKRIDLYRDWTPEKRDISLIEERIREKVNMKPNWYRRSRRLTR